MNIDKRLRRTIVEAIIARSDFMGKFSQFDGIVLFLNEIWPLREMGSNDSRFSNALDDIYQHVVNNHDWDFNYLFFERLSIVEGDIQYFVKFIEFVVSPQVRNNRTDILRYVDITNGLFAESQYRLGLVSYFENLPLYKLRESSSVQDLPIDISKNEIIFYKDNPETYPCFVLIYDNWDDFGFKTHMGLYYFTLEKTEVWIGTVKILHKDEINTWNTLEQSFVNLPKEYCSIGQSIEYYENLKSSINANFQSILIALRDVAFFPKIHEHFETTPGFVESLLRDNSVEKLLRTARYELNELDLRTCFSFSYSFTPPYTDIALNIFFDFKHSLVFEHRLFALIGKNGTGKTRLLAMLAKDLGDRKTQKISPKRPLYSKVFSVSYSYFDQFEIPSGDASFNYVYCGLRKTNGDWLNQKELLERFTTAVSHIAERNLTRELYLTLFDFIPEDLLGEVFVQKYEDYEGDDGYLLRDGGFDSLFRKLSSGQNMIIFVLTEVLSHIRFNSLILYDEPETHLHPNAISSLMFTLFNLLKRFESFCILATHSPIVIQEIPSRDIYVIERENELAELRRLGNESFGENLTVITNEIFGNRTIAKHHYQVLEELVRSKKTFDEILQIIQSDSLPIPLNTKLYIQSLIQRINEES